MLITAQTKPVLALGFWSRAFNYRQPDLSPPTPASAHLVPGCILTPGGTGSPWGGLEGPGSIQGDESLSSPSGLPEGQLQPLRGEQ